jgi:hypothetical protein
MDRFVIRKKSYGDVGTSRQPTDCTNPSINSVLREINLDKLPPADQKRIPEYTKNPRKQDDELTDRHRDLDIHKSLL